MSKTITIVTANYYPEETAIGFYTTQFSRFLKDSGYNINIITGFPYYPQWEIYQDYENKENFIIEDFSGITIYRSRQYVPSKPTFFSRIKMMATFVKGVFKNIKKIEQTDLVITIVPFTFSIIPAYWLSRKTKSKLWIHIQDFEFDLAFETGILAKRNLFSKLFKKVVLLLESFLLNKAEIVSSISQNMMIQAQKRTKNKSLYLFPNWISEKQLQLNTSLIHPYFNKDKFSILYSGNIGDKQNWTLLENLCQLIPSETAIEFIIVGSGGYLETLKDKLQQYSFVSFKPVVPLDELGQLLTSAQLHFLFQKTDVIDSVMPSKILGMMASGRPSIISGHKDSEVARIFNSNDVGCFFYENNSLKIYEKIIALKNDTHLCATYGKNARKFVWENFSEKKIMSNFTNQINKILNE